MNIADLFGEMGGLSPKQYGMSGAQFAAFCCAIPSRDFLLTFTCIGNGIRMVLHLRIHLM